VDELVCSDGNRKEFVSDPVIGRFTNDKLGNKFIYLPTAKMVTKYHYQSLKVIE
jgi:hypothetical protein